MAHPSSPPLPVGESRSQAPGKHLDAELNNDSFIFMRGFSWSLLIPEHLIRGKPLMCWPRTGEGNGSEQKFGEAAKYCVKSTKESHETLCFLVAATGGYTVFGPDSSTVPAARRARS